MGSSGIKLRPLTPPSSNYELGQAQSPAIGQAYTPNFMNPAVPMAVQKARGMGVEPQMSMPNQTNSGQVYYNHYGVPVGMIGPNNNVQESAFKKASALATSQWGRGTAGFFGF